MDPSSDNMFADNTVYVQIDEYRVELYAEYKSTAIEKVLEDVFKAHEIPWNKDSDYIESEKMNRTSYYIEI
ncbi:tail terminator [Acetoanaerobium phage ANDSL2_ph1]